MSVLGGDVNGRQGSAYRFSSSSETRLIWTTADGRAATLSATSVTVDQLFRTARSVR